MTIFNDHNRLAVMSSKLWIFLQKPQSSRNNVKLTLTYSLINSPAKEIFQFFLYFRILEQFSVSKFLRNNL